MDWLGGLLVLPLLLVVFFYSIYVSTYLRIYVCTYLHVANV